MDKVIKVVKVIAYLISIVLPMLDGAKEVKNQVNNIYKGA